MSADDAVPVPEPVPKVAPAQGDAAQGDAKPAPPHKARDRGARKLPAKPVAPTRPARIFYELARRLLFGISRALWRFTVEGTELVPDRGGFIVAPVHRSNIDTILMSGVTKRRLCFLAKAGLWKFRAFGWLVSSLGGFPVRRGAADREALRVSVEVLEQGQPLVVFPEGGRRSGPEVAELFEGAAYLSLRTGVPIVPVGIGGSEGALPVGARLPSRVKVHMVIGAPLFPPGSAPGAGAARPARVRRHEIDALSQRLHDQLQVLFDQALEVSGVESRQRPGWRK